MFVYLVPFLGVGRKGEMMCVNVHAHLMVNKTDNLLCSVRCFSFCLFQERKNFPMCRHSSEATVSLICGSQCSSIAFVMRLSFCKREAFLPFPLEEEAERETPDTQLLETWFPNCGSGPWLVATLTSDRLYGAL